MVSIVRETLYGYLRQGRWGSRMIYLIGAISYWLVFGRRLYVGTRIVEIPYVLNQLHHVAHGGERILQVGDVLSKEMALDHYEVELVDLGAESVSKPGLKVHKVDIRDVSLPQSYFDIAISISTLEHIGLQGPSFPDGDKLAIDIINQALKPGGLFLLTVPFGKSAVRQTFRVYDGNRINAILGDYFNIEEEAFFVWRGLKWRRTSREDAGRVGFLNNNPSMILGVALVLARKTRP